MQIIYYNQENWVTERYPYDLPKGDYNIEVSDEDFEKTLTSPQHFAWRVIDGTLTNERYEETPAGETLRNLRNQRDAQCFSIVNRGNVWYDTLTNIQKEELAVWYREWLDVTETRVVPQAPIWLN